MRSQFDRRSLEWVSVNKQIHFHFEKLQLEQDERNQNALRSSLKRLVLKKQRLAKLLKSDFLSTMTCTNATIL